MNNKIKGGLLKPFEICEFSFVCLRSENCYGTNKDRDNKFSCATRRGLLIVNDFEVIYGKTIDEITT